jgi:hypothetical protein
MSEIMTNVVGYNILCKMEGVHTITSAPTKWFIVQFEGQGFINNCRTRAWNSYRVRMCDKMAYIDENINDAWVLQTKISKNIFSGLYLLALAKERMAWADNITIERVADGKNDTIAPLWSVDHISIDYDDEEHRLIVATIE